MSKTLLIFLLSLHAARSFAAPCCAGGGSFLSLLNEEEKRQVTVSFSSLGIAADSPAGGGDAVRRPQTDEELRQRFDVSWSELVADRWQAGLLVPIGRRLRTRAGRGGTDAGLGDVQATVGYEFLPEWSYSAWKPRGVLFARATAPTGTATWESAAPYGLDAHGGGFWMFAAGAYFTKIVGDWDFLTWGHVQNGLSTTVETPFVYKLTPGWGAATGLSAGYSVGDLRLGASVGKNWEGDIQREGGVSGPIPGTVFTTAGLSAAYLVDKRVSFTLQYTDQVLLGGAKNAALGRGVGVVLRTRFERD